jgi:hypothetical protein
MSDKPGATAPTLLVTTLAAYQTRFWIEVAEKLVADGHRCSFLSFDDRSTEMIRARGFEAFSCGESPRTPIINEAQFQAVLEQYDIKDPAYWLGHERVTFGIASEQALRQRLADYLSFADASCRELMQRGPVTMVQEVGGFICVIASYFAAIRLGIDNWFIEPSFFRGRLFFTRNTFAAPQPMYGIGAIADEVRSYLTSTLAGRKIVVPLKDSHQYNAVTRKIFNKHNSLRLVQKLFDKFILGKHQEFGHIGHHVRTHLRMLASSLRLRPHYRGLEGLGKFVYFPFHVPADMALTIRAPQYLDQLALVSQVASTLPPNIKLAVKEHPAMIGAMDAGRLVELLRQHSNLVLLDSTCNNFDVLGRAQLVISVNSKSGAEALLAGTPVIALGDSFYKQSGVVHSVEQLDEARKLVAALLAGGKQGPDSARVESFFQRVWDSSFPGELFVATPDNARVFGSSLVAALARSGRDLSPSLS